MSNLDLILTSLKYSLCIIALFMSMQEGMLLHPVKKLLSNWIWVFVERVVYRRDLSKLGSYYEVTVPISKPLWDCLICMASFWSILFWFLQGHQLSADLLWVILMTCGLNTLASGFISDIVFKYHKARTSGS